MPKRILIVDDDKTTAKQLTKMIQSLKFEVAGVAADGLSAVEMAVNDSVDLILMDIVLPANINGLEAAERIRKKKKIPIIFITVYDRQEFFERAKNSNPEAFILKPFNERELELAISLAFYKTDAEKQLRLKEKQLEKILDSASDILFTITPDGKIISLTKAFEKHLGFKIKDWINEDVKKLIPDATVPVVKLIRDRILTGETVQPFEVQILSHTGAFVFFETTVEPIYKKNKIDLIFGFARNINERKKSEEIARRHSMMFNNIKSAILVTDLEGRIIDLNPAAEKLFGYSKTELLFSNINKLQKANSPEMIAPDILAVLERDGKWTGEFDFIHKNGKKGIAISTLLPLKDEEGSILAHFSLNDDLSEWRSIEAALDQSYKRFELVSLATQDAIYDWDINNKKTWLNEHFRALFLKENEVVNDPDLWWNQHVHPDDFEKTSVSVTDSFINDVKSWTGEYRLRKNDGTYAYVIDRGYIERDENKKALRVIGAITDITALKQNEMRLLEGEKRYKAILDLSPELIFIQSEEKIVFINNSAVKILGGSSYNDFVGKNFAEVIHPEYLEHGAKFFSDLNSASEGNNLEYKFISRNGDKIDVELSAIKTNWKGTPAIQIVARDIRSEKMHQHIQSTETEILTMVAQGYPLSQVLNKLCRHNEEIFPGAHCTILELKENELSISAGNSDQSSVRDLIKKISSVALKSFHGSKSFSHEPRFIRSLKDEPFVKEIVSAETLPIVSCWCMPITDTLNKMIGLLLIYFNKEVTPNGDSKYILEKSARIASVLYSKQKLEAEVFKLSLVAEQTDNSVMILDTNYKITWVNSAFEKLTDYKSAEVLGKIPFDFLSGLETDSALRKEKFEILKKGESVRYSIVNYDKHGEKYWVNALIDPMFDADDKLLGYFIIEYDITESVEKNLQLEAALAKVEESNKLIRSFTANMSHEIRTPLNGILGYAEIIEEEAMKIDNALFIRYAQTINRSGHRLLNLLNDILDISKIEANKLDVKLLSIDGNLLIAKVVSLLQHAAEKKGIKISLQKNTESFLRADEMRLSQVLNNIISNAVKFTVKGGIIISTNDAKNSAGENIFEIKIIDSGIGMSEEFLAHAFDAFTQESSGFARTHEGSGLGLAITKRLCELMDGAIEIESEKGVGTTVTVSFPAISLDERDEIIEPSSIDVTPIENELNKIAPKILIVEDDESSRKLLDINLKKYGMVTSARDGSDALRAIEILNSNGETYDVILMDIGLPRPWSGIELRVEIMKRFLAYSKIPFIAQTALALKSDREKILAEGFDYFIPKPINKSTLLQTIHDALTRKNST